VQQRTVTKAPINQEEELKQAEKLVVFVIQLCNLVAWKTLW
jgi:hypothetical protein